MSRRLTGISPVTTGSSSSTTPFFSGRTPQEKTRGSPGGRQADRGFVTRRRDLADESKAAVIAVPPACIRSILSRRATPSTILTSAARVPHRRPKNLRSFVSSSQAGPRAHVSHQPLLEPAFVRGPEVCPLASDVNRRPWTANERSIGLKKQRPGVSSPHRGGILRKAARLHGGIFRNRAWETLGGTVEQIFGVLPDFRSADPASRALY